MIAKGLAPVTASIEERTPQGIAMGISRLISSGDLAPGDRLPTVRELAAELGVSPATVSHGWQALAAAGLITSRGRSGSFVRSTPRAWLPPRYRSMAGLPDARLDLSTGTPDPELLPGLGAALESASERVSRRAGTASYLEVPVIPELEVLLRETWPFTPGGLTVVDGALDALSRSLDEILQFGDRVVVEDPGFPPVFDLLDRFGAERIPVALDEYGMRPDLLATALTLGPVAIVLQPRAQNPTGVSMTAARAQELAAVIRQSASRQSSRTRRDVIVIEDDHSGEIATAADVSLGAALPDQVVHIRSFSKSHGPDLRIAALGGPDDLIDRVVARRILGPGWTSRMLQTVLFHLLTDAVPVAEVAHARSLYRERQDSLAMALTAAGVPARGGDGINTWLEVADERAAVRVLAAAGIRVAAGTPFLADEGRQFVRVTAGMVRTDAAAIGRALAEAARA